MRTLNELVEAARARGPARIAVAAGHDPDVLESLKKAAEIGLADATLFGDAAQIRRMASAAGYTLAPDRVIDERDDATAARRAIALIHTGQADLLMKGKLNTATLIRCALDKDNGLRTGRQLSQVIVFEAPGVNRLMLLSDAAINVAPGLQAKAEICRNAIEVAHAIGIPRPNLAALCALEFVNPDMPATVDAAALTMMNRRGQIPGAYIEGPIALDVPLSRFAAQRKDIESPLVDNTDIFIAPDIEAANILYRAVVYFAGAESGGIVVGARVPLILLSRAESPETKLRSIAIGWLVSQHGAARSAAL